MMQQALIISFLGDVCILFVLPQGPGLNISILLYSEGIGTEAHSLAHKLPLEKLKG